MRGSALWTTARTTFVRFTHKPTNNFNSKQLKQKSAKVHQAIAKICLFVVALRNENWNVTKKKVILKSHERVWLVWNRNFWVLGARIANVDFLNFNLFANQKYRNNCILLRSFRLSNGEFIFDAPALHGVRQTFWDPKGIFLCFWFELFCIFWRPPDTQQINMRWKLFKLLNSNEIHLCG